MFPPGEHTASQSTDTIGFVQWVAGHTIGPYELVARIGAGGMGEVWKAYDARLHRSVAIKRLTVEHARRFTSEARAIAALNHPNICQIHDVGPDYLVLEYIEGTPSSVRTRLQRPSRWPSRLPPLSKPHTPRASFIAI
jgi:eukaryotic-like serine/threonine-protein kinase